MLRFELVDNINSALATDNLVIGADFFDTGTHFHADHSPSWEGDSLLLTLTFAIGDSSLRKIVRGQLDRNAVTRDETDEMLPHLAGDVSYNLMAVLKLDPKLSPRKGLDYGACQLDYFLVNCHKYN